MNLYYDRQGTPISAEQWNELFFDRDYQQVARWEGEGGLLCSTVWLGIDHGFGMFDEGGPVIFETMVFGLPERYGELQHRYRTEEQAIEGHDRAVTNLVCGERVWFL